MVICWKPLSIKSNSWVVKSKISSLLLSTPPKEIFWLRVKGCKVKFPVPLILPLISISSAIKVKSKLVAKTSSLKVIKVGVVKVVLFPKLTWLS